MRSKHVALVKSYGRIYQRLSSALRGEVALEVNSKWFAQIHLLADANERLCVQIAVSLQGARVLATSLDDCLHPCPCPCPCPCAYMTLTRHVHTSTRTCLASGNVFAPSEYMPATNLYLLHRGVAFIDGRVKGGGKTWGLLSLMHTLGNNRSSAVAFTYCEVLYLSLIHI